MTIALIIAVFFLAYSNGANDNFKGVATLYGCGEATFGRARLWATATTIAGGLVSIALAASLVKAFSGHGLVPADVANSPALLVSIGSAGAATILLATLLGMPTSTTHALTGALLGVSLLANGAAGVPFIQLSSGFLAPLLVSPVLAVALAGGMYLVLRRLRIAMGITRQTCICVGPAREAVPVALTMHGTISGASERAASIAESMNVGMTLGETPQCVERYSGRLIGIDAQAAVGTIHYISAGAVCFARAVNDTPKIAALLMMGGAVAGWQLAWIAIAMAVGGMVQSRKVAETMSKRITAEPLNPGQGLTGNLATALLVIVASRLGLPVSTTHVSVGSIFGIGLVGGSAGRSGPRWKTCSQIAATWITTLPMGALLGAGIYYVLSNTGAG